MRQCLALVTKFIVVAWNFSHCFIIIYILYVIYIKYALYTLYPYIFIISWAQTQYQKFPRGSINFDLPEKNLRPGQSGKYPNTFFCNIKSGQQILYCPRIISSSVKIAPGAFDKKNKSRFSRKTSK